MANKELIEEVGTERTVGRPINEVTEKIKEINKTFPPYKYIKNMILTDKELIKTTTKKIKRNEEMRHLGQV